MASWQKPTRIGVAIVGLASAAAVYFTMGERRSAPPPKPVQFTNPKATAEISGCAAERFDWAKKYVEIKQCDRLVYFEDGSAKVLNGVFVVPKGEDRTFTISAQETTLGKDESRFEMGGAIRLDDSDGFFLTTDRATFDVKTSFAESPGAVMFGKGRMSGSGIGMTYDQKQNVLRVNSQAQVTTVDDAGRPIMQFSSATTMFDRVQHVLTADMNVHVVREKQVIDTNHAEARLTEMNDVVTFLQLRGDSRVTGGEASIENMSARDIDLDYTDDGKRLEALKLAGSSAIAMTGEAGKPGRQIHGEAVALSLAADGTLTRAVAGPNARLELPAAAEVPQRNISAQTLDATGEPGKGLTSATFTTDVTFTETARPPKAGASAQSGKRTARAEKLEARLADDAVTAATFSGAEVTFEETGLKSCSARLEYEPGKGTLQLSGATKGGNPIVAQERVAIEGQTIDVGLDNRRMKAKGSVVTLLNSVSRCKPAEARPPDEQGSSRTPGLLKDDAPVTIVGGSLDYDSETGYAEYTGTGSQRPTLEQADTRISGDTLVIDQTKGDLRASGNATSILTIDDKRMNGRANEIRYSDERRLVAYSATRQPDTAAAARTAPPATEVYLGSGPDSNLRATGRIEIFLDAKSNTLNRMSARSNIRVVEGVHTVTGGANSTLEYGGATEQYVVKAAGPPPISVVKRESGGCRETLGYSVTFYKNKDMVSVDGNQMGTATSAPSKSGCTPAR